MDESNELDKEKNKDLPVIYEIFKKIYLKAPPVLKDLSEDSVDIDYKEFVEDPIDFEKIEQKFQEEKYCSVTDAIKDIRLVFLNCYKFYGAKSDYTLKSLELEGLLEQKISDCDEQFKSLADVQLTLNLLNLEKDKSFQFRYPKNCYDSVLLRCVAHYRNTRLKKYHNVLSTTLTTDADSAHTLEEVLSWENEIYFNDNYRYISSMWELPEIGNFVAILFKELDLDIINQGEIERMFLMPKESTTMSQIMTTLLTPFKKTKFNSQVMPYQIWSDKLGKKVSDWYKVYNSKKQNKVSVMSSLGIHPDFWVIVGDTNPLVDSDYCQLSYFMKVWLVKGLCDHVISKYKSINDVISNCNERHSTIWKNDMETEEYFYFHSMPDFRIYYYNIPYDEPSLEFLELEKTDNEVKEDDASSDSSVPNIFHEKSRFKPNENHFKLIADSVDGLRSFLGELDTEDSSVPENLISALEDFIIQIEPQEYHLIVLNNHSKIKLFKDWKSYSNRIKEDEDAILIWKEKEIKPKPIVANEEIILEKRVRKTVFKPDFDIDIKFESAENLFETDEESIDDLTDSEDEWGAMNQPRNRAKSSIQVPSKLAELENRLRDESKTSKKCHKKNTKENSHGLDKLQDNEVENEKKVIDENRKEDEGRPKDSINISINNFSNEIDLSSDDVYDIEKEESIHGNEVENKNQLINEKKKKIKVRSKDSTNTYNNGFSKELVHSKNLEDINNEFEISSDKVVSVNIEKNTSILGKENKLADEYKKEKKVRCIDSTVNGFRKELVHSKNVVDINNEIEIFSDEEVVSIDIDIEGSNACKKQKFVDKSLDEQPQIKKTKNADIVILDDDKLDGCEIIRDDSPLSIISNTSVGAIIEINELDDSSKNKSAELNLNKNDEVISIEDDDEQIVISDDDDIQIISATSKPQVYPGRSRRCYTVNNNLNRSFNPISRNNQLTTTKYTNRQVASTSMPKLSPNISIMPANVHVPKGIEVTIVKRPQPLISSHFNVTKRTPNGSSSNNSTKNPSFVNVQCKVISKPNFNGEVKFFVKLPNGSLHPVSDELMNQYLKDHNSLPDYWLVPLPVEVARQYGFN